MDGKKGRRRGDPQQMRNGVASERGKGGQAGFAIFWIVGSRNKATSQRGAQLHVLRTDQVTKAIRFLTESKQHCRRLMDWEVHADR